MQPQIKLLDETLLIGKRTTMSLNDDHTTYLWQSFMPDRGLVPNRSDENYYSVEVYPANYFDAFDADAKFEKWAAVAADDDSMIPIGMDKLLLPEGFYAVFSYKGLAKDVEVFFKKIFNQWLPQSKYAIDDRPHFAVMGPHYNPHTPDSVEEIYIPILEK